MSPYESIVLARDLKESMARLVAILATVFAISISSISCIKDDMEEDGKDVETEYTLGFGEIPTSFGEGEETTVIVTLRTNIPIADLVIETPDWITATVKEGSVSVVIAANRTVDAREGEVILKDTKNRVKTVSFHVTQDWLLVNGEGMVPFKDKAFKKAILAIADENKDLDISMDEAKTLREIDACAKGIVDLTGIECFSCIEKLDLRDNDIRRVWLDDPAIYSMLKYIDLTGNGNLESDINVSGCYIGTSIYLGMDNRWQYSIKTSEPAFYETSDYSHNGLHSIQNHSKGNGIHLIFVTTEYVDLDYESGAVRELVEYQTRQLFSVEPFSSLEEYFDVSYFAFVAPNERERVRITDYPELRQELQSIANDETKYHIVIFFNTEGLNGNGRAYASPFNQHGWPGNVSLTERRRVFPGELGSDYTLPHEMGHAIGGLEDEYVEDRVHSDARPNFTKDMNHIPWQRFLEHENYKDRVGIFPRNEGYVPSEYSIMGDSYKYIIFNSPSRYAIFRNVLYLSTWNISNWDYPDPWEEFLEYDKINDDLPI